MSTRTAKILMGIFGALHALVGLSFLLLPVYLAFTGVNPGTVIILLWLVPGGIYFTWLGYRGWRKPSPRVISQICSTMFLVLSLPFVVLVLYSGWPHDSLGVALPSVSIVLFAFWLSTFGKRILIRKLSPPK